MQYQGPESFRGLIEKSYETIKTFFPRDGSPNIIVGGIGKIYDDGQRTITEGDEETNSKIDQSFRALLKKTPNDGIRLKRAYDRLIDACNDANTLRPAVFGEYNHSLDMVFFAPDRIVKFIVASGLDPRTVMCSGNTELMTDYLMDLNFHHKFAHEMVHWAFGDTQFNKDLRNYFRAIGFTFDKRKEGKFSYHTAVAEVSKYEKDAEEAAVNGFEANARLSNHFAQMKRQGIHELEEMVAEIGAARIAPPSHGIVAISGRDDIARKLFAQIQSKGPKEFIRHMKSIEDTAYLEHRYALELL